MAAAARPLETAVFAAPSELTGKGGAYPRIQAAGATKVRLLLDWRNVAPETRGPGFRPGDPAHPAYRWAAFDRLVVETTRRGLQPIVTILAAPDWATGKAGTGEIWTRRPDPVELGLFARAAAVRYGGSFEGLPRVRYWMVWNEPNIELYLTPQRVKQKAVAFAWYRRMLNSSARAIHEVDPENVVIGGGLTPFRYRDGQGPLAFMRDLFCLRRDLKPKCRTKTELDVWAHHPYTSGDPLHRANVLDDVSLGDLPKMRSVLRAAERQGMIRSRRPVGFWVTEFSWDTKPPDLGGVPAALHARWVSEALYRMWKNGVTLVTWFRVRDEPLGQGPHQSGLYYANGRAKPALQAFRFPFVALREGGPGVLVWGRVPESAPADVAVQRRFGGRWVRVATFRANRYGIFRGRLALKATRGFLRARLVGGEISRPFNLATPPDLRVNPVGDR